MCHNAELDTLIHMHDGSPDRQAGLPLAEMNATGPPSGLFHSKGAFSCVRADLQGRDFIQDLPPRALAARFDSRDR